MLKDVVLQDFELDTKVFNVSVQGEQVVSVIEPENILNILSVTVLANGKEKHLSAAGFFEVQEIEVRQSIFKGISKASIPFHIYSIENYKFENVLTASPGSEINLKGKANVGLPDGNVVVDLVVAVELKDAFFSVIVSEFPDVPAEAKLARKIFRQTAQEKHIPPEITDAIAMDTGEKIGINWKSSKFNVAQFKNGMIVELEHGLVDPQTNVTNDDLVMTGKIALAHLKERHDYYIKLDEMEKTPVEKI